MSIEDLENARPGEPLRYIVGGAHYAAPLPVDLHFQDLLKALQDEELPGLPRMPYWKTRALFARWVAHHDLPTFRHAHRLVYLIDRYSDEIEYDLRVLADEDLGTLWRTRRWRYLLNLVDHLPSNCWYTAAVSNDEEHARMMAEAMAEQERAPDAEDSGPPVQFWDQHAAMLADLIDATRAIPQALVAANGGKPKEMPPYPRPKTALERARKLAAFESRKARHEKLVQRVLPHKRDDYVPPPPSLPPGWRRDAGGRLRDERGRYAKMPT